MTITPIATPDAVTRCIAEGLANGWHSERIARHLREQLGGQVIPKVE